MRATSPSPIRHSDRSIVSVRRLSIRRGDTTVHDGRGAVELDPHPTPRRKVSTIIWKPDPIVVGNLRTSYVLKPFDRLFQRLRGTSVPKSKVWRSEATKQVKHASTTACRCSDGRNQRSLDLGSTPLAHHDASS